MGQYEHHVYVPLAKGSPPGMAETIQAIPKVTVTYSYSYRSIHRLCYSYKQRLVRSALTWREALSCEPVCVHAHSLFSAGGTAYDLHRERATKYIVAVRNSDVNLYFKYAIHLRSTGARILAAAERVIFLSPAYRDYVLERYVPRSAQADIAHKAIVVPNGIDSSWLAAPPQKQREAPGRKVRLLFVGEICKNKNVRGVVTAAELLRSRGLGVELDIVGVGPELSTVYALARARPWIKVHGEISDRKALRALFLGADVFVMPSFFETFGLVYGEAMSQAMPVVYSKSQGIDGYFPNGCVGRACDPHYPKDIAEGITRVLEDYTGVSARALEASVRFAWPAIARDYLTMYAQLESIR
jgi:glycosyltransferase involved in cell wall biosynthesis